MNAEILAIGDEITGGQLLDTNSQWLSQRLGELGIRVLYHSTVGDELEPCREVFRRAIERADIVIATGGLGPTADDLTREAPGRGRRATASPGSRSADARPRPFRPAEAGNAQKQRAPGLFPRRQPHHTQP